jgi:RNA-directed DNA polymerase
VKRTTVRKRLRAKLQQLKQQLRVRMHDPAALTGEWLRSVVQGYFNYHAVPGNLDSLWTFRVRLTRLWRTTLRRRSQRSRPNWDRINLLAARWLPIPRVLHPWPEQRFAASHPR